MAIYFISSLFIMLFGYFFQPMLNKKRKKIFIIVSFGILIIIAAMRHYTVGIDVEKHYMRRFLEISDFSLAEIPTYAKSVGYEIGYCYFTKLLNRPTMLYYRHKSDNDGGYGILYISKI